MPTIAKFILLCAIMVAMPGHAAEIKPKLAGVWQISGELFVKPLNSDINHAVIGKQVRISQSDLVSPFAECIRCGLKISQRKVTDSVLRRELQRPALEFPHGYALVHDLSWPQGQLKVIQIDDDIAYVVVDGRIYVMNQQPQP